MNPSRLLNVSAATVWDSFRNMLKAPVDGGSLAVFRICFGLVMLWHTLKYLWPNAHGNLLKFYYVNVGWNFPYHGFEWVRPWPEPWLTVHFVVLALASLFVALGLFYRLASVTLFLSYTYVFLMDEAKYNNHYYLMCLVQFLLIWMPAQARYSIDAWWNSRTNKIAVLSMNTAGHISPPCPVTVSFWPVFLIRAQLFFLYVYGGIAKINVDWLTGIPLVSIGTKLHEFLDRLIWLPDGVGITQLCLFLAWTGLLYDLLIGFLLLIRRTRILGIVLTLMFHTTNNHLFPIGVFPIMAFTATLIFLEPDWPGRFWQWLRRPRLARPNFKWLLGGAVLLPVVGAALGWKGRRAQSPDVPALDIRRHRWVVAFVGAWLITQTLIPLRHFLIAGDANWTEEGHSFSWRMMLRAKAAGHILFDIRDPAVQVASPDGKPRVDWDNWPDNQSRKIYVPVDSHRFNWYHHPGLTMVYEPTVGERIIFNPNNIPLAAGDVLKGFRSQINRQWEEAFGCHPEIHETISLSDALRAARLSLETVEGKSTSDRKSLSAELERIDSLLWSYTPEGRAAEPNPNRRFVAIADALQKLVESDFGSTIKKHLSRVHPFSLQGAEFSGMRFLVVDDPQLTAQNRSLALQKLSHDKPYIVWVDLVRLRPEGWHGLPAALISFERKRLRILWNHFRELNSIQIERLACRPYMIHQYGQRIAKLWKLQTGRRPEVHVSSFVMLNYHRPCYLIDPNVDLAGTPYRLFRHNEWILPYKKHALPLPKKQTLLQFADEERSRRGKARR